MDTMTRMLIDNVGVSRRQEIQRVRRRDALAHSLPHDQTVPRLAGRTARVVRRIGRSAPVVMVPNPSKVSIGLDRLDQTCSSRSQAIAETHLRKREPSPL